MFSLPTVNDEDDDDVSDEEVVEASVPRKRGRLSKRARVPDDDA